MPTLSIKTYIDIAAGVIVLLFLAWVFHEGEKRIEAADARAVAAQVIHNEEVQRQAALAIDAVEARYRTAFVAAPVAPVHVRVCNPARPVALPSGAAAPSGPDAAADIPSPVGQESGDDIGPDTDHLFDQADAQIEGLQAVIRAYLQETAHGK